MGRAGTGFSREERRKIRWEDQKEGFCAFLTIAKLELTNWFRLKR